MRKNSMTKCAVGAMLFGGTLGASSSASAALVVWNCNLNLAYTAATGYVGVYVNVQAKQATFTDGGSSQQPGDDLYFGFNSPMGITSVNPGQTVSVAGGSGIGGYSVAQLASGTIIGSTLASPLSWGNSCSIMTAGGSNSWVQGGSNLFGFSFQDSAGQLRYGWGEITLDAGTYGSGVLTKLVYQDTGASVTAGVVPAPGALALLGIAGFAGSRRRRD